MRVRSIALTKKKQSQVQSPYAEVMLTLKQPIPESLDGQHAIAKQTRKALEVWQLEVDAKLEDAKSRAIQAHASRTQDAFSEYLGLARRIELEAQAILRESEGSLDQGSHQIAEQVCEKAVSAQWEAIEGTSLSPTHQPYDQRRAPSRWTMPNRPTLQPHRGGGVSATSTAAAEPSKDHQPTDEATPTKVTITDDGQPNWVHEVQQPDLGMGGRTLCGLRLDSNWEATLAPVTCSDCLRPA